MAWIGVVKGSALAVVAAVCFTIADLFVFATRESVNQETIFAANAVPGFFLCALSMLYRRPDVSPIYSNIGWVTISGFLQTIDQCAILYAIPRLGPGDTKALYFTLPIYVMVLSFLFLGDRITKAHVVCAICSVLGVVLVTRSEIDSASRLRSNGVLDTIVVVSIVVLAAIIYATALTIRRFLVGRKIDSLTLQFSFFAQFSVVSCLLCTLTKSWDIPENLTDIIMTCGHGPLTWLGFLLVFIAVEYATPSTVTIITPLNVPLDYVAQLFLFRSLPVEFMVIAGACLTVGSSISIALISILQTYEETPKNDGELDHDEEQRLTE